MDARTGTRLATVLIDEAHEAAARDRRASLAASGAARRRRAPGGGMVRVAGGIAAVLAAGVLLLASWSPVAAAGQAQPAGVTGPAVLADVGAGATGQADPPAKARPASHRTSPDRSAAIALLVAAVVGAAFVGGIAASNRRSTRKHEPGQAGGRMASGSAATAK